MKETTFTMQPSPLQNGRNEKAQVISTEFILASGIFLMILTSIFVLWNTTTSKMRESEILYEMDDVSTNAIEKLVRTVGYPKDWEDIEVDNVSALGLITESRVLDEEKVLRFLNITGNFISPNPFDNPCSPPITNYNCNRHFLGMGKYDFYFDITYPNGTTVRIQGQNCTSGVMPGDAKKLTKKRNALLDKDIVKIKLTVWYD